MTVVIVVYSHTSEVFLCMTAIFFTMNAYKYIFLICNSIQVIFSEQCFDFILHYFFLGSEYFPNMKVAVAKQNVAHRSCFFYF